MRASPVCTQAGQAGITRFESLFHPAKLPTLATWTGLEERSWETYEPRFSWMGRDDSAYRYADPADGQAVAVTQPGIRLEVAVCRPNDRVYFVHHLQCSPWFDSLCRDQCVVAGYSRHR